jgi:hypothetical protein
LDKCNDIIKADGILVKRKHSGQIATIVIGRKRIPFALKNVTPYIFAR